MNQKSYAEIDELIKKLGDSPEWKVNSYKTILQGCRERKDKAGVKKWESRVSEAESRAFEFKKLNRKRQVFRHALSILTDPKHPDYGIELDYLEVVRRAELAYKEETAAPVSFESVVKQEPIIRHNFNEMRQRPLRGWRQGRMSQLIAGGY
jgi:hypothetical protein